MTGLGESFEPDLNTGTATYGLNIEVSPGVNGFAPVIRLVYNSGSGNSPLGIGWNLNHEYIQRQTDKGIPSYTTNDIFIHSGSGELVPLPDDIFRAKIEGSFTKYKKLASGWQAWRKDGTQLFFGTDNTGQQTNSRGIFAWYLQKQIDTNGNEIRFSYFTDQGSLYLDEIRYSIVSDTVYKSVHFIYENRPDVFTSYVSREKVTTAKRLQAIEVRSTGDLVRRYSLQYKPDTIFSLLASVTQYGKDSTTSLPPVSFSYTEYSTDNMQTVNMNNPPPAGVNPGNSNVDLVDINGDGLPDLVHTDPVQHHHAFYINDGNGDWRENPVIPDASPGDLLQTNGVMMSDMNGDGRADLFVKGLSRFGYYKNSGGLKWEEPDWTPCSPNPSFSFEDTNIRLLDVNNDKLIDVVISDDNSQSYKIWLNHQNNQWNDAFDYQTWLPNGYLSFTSASVKLGDMNGDRIQDLVYVLDGYVSYFPGKGNGEFGEEVEMTGDPAGLGSLAAKLATADIDGNGLSDLVLVGNETVTVWFNNGRNGFKPGLTFENTPQFSASAAYRFADMNGDGYQDLLITDPAAVHPYSFVSFNNGVRPNLLTGISNGLGRETEISYRPSTVDYLSDRANGVPWTTCLPFPMQVVAGVTVRDLNSGQEYRSEYHYRNGYYDGIEKEFRGFAEVKKTEFGDLSAPTLVSAYSFDVGQTEESRKGLILSVATLEENGTIIPPVNLFNRQENEIFTNTLFTGLNGEQVRFSYIDATTTSIYEKTAIPVTLYQEIEQDNYGNTTKSFQYGIVEGANRGAGNDEVLTTSTYLIDETNWIVDRPVTISKVDLDNNFISLERNFYDAKGNLTRKEKSPDGTNFIPLLRNDYDSYGNIIRMTDANDHCREISYDTLFHTFPVTETICGPGLTITATYDTGLGKITEHKDFNGHATRYQYDPLGRITAIIKPGDSAALPTQNFTYKLGSPVSSVFTRIREQSGEPGTYDAVTYYDGLGRKLQTRSEGENNNWVVNGATTFNQRQQPRQQWLPYFSTTSAYQSPDANKPYSTVFYDAQMRPVRQIQPDATFSSTSYAPLTKTVFDEEDNGSGPHANTPHVFIQDGLERLIEVREKNGSETYITRYSYDGQGNLIKIVDNENNIKTMEFDGLGRKIAMFDPDKHRMTYTYDPAGNLIATVDARGQEVHYTYDEAGRLLSEEFGGVVRVRNHYDNDLAAAWPDLANTLGRLAWTEDEAGKEYFSYDNRGNRVARVRELAGKTFISRMDYDAMDRLTALTYPDGFTLAYRYNAMNRLDSIPGFVDNIDYNAAGRKTRLEYANNITSRYAYDRRQRLTRLLSSAPAKTLQDLSYGYDRVGNITTITDGRPGKTPEDRSRTFTYDDLYRLTGAVAPDWNRSYQYSSIGNMIFKTDAGTMTYGEGTAGPHAVTTVAGAGLTYSYDENGNLAGKTPGFTFAFDHRDRMTSAVRTSDNTQTTYIYDASGSRKIKRVTRNGHTSETLYVDKFTELRQNTLIKQVYADNRLVARIYTPFDAALLNSAVSPPGRDAFDVNPADGVITLAEIKARGNDPEALEPAEVGDALRLYYENLATDPGLLSFATMAEAMGRTGNAEETASGTIYFYLPDHLGSPEIVTDGDGNVVEESVFYPYGQDRARTGAFASEYRFTGKELDDETGLHYFEARYYDSLVGRFVSVDPMSYTTEDSENFSQVILNYGYVHNNPVFFIDQDGNFAVPVLAVPLVTGAVGATIGIGTVAFDQFLLGKEKTGADYAGAATGGFIAGAMAPIVATALAGSGPVLIGASWFALGATGAATGNFTKQIFDSKKGVDVDELMMKSAVEGIEAVVGGVIAGKILGTGLKLGGDSIGKQLITKSAKGQIKNVTMKPLRGIAYREMLDKMVSPSTIIKKYMFKPVARKIINHDE